MIKPAMQILLIEDNESDVILMEEILSQDTLNSFEFTISESLDTGLETLHRHEFDAILLDLGLPDSQGLETFLKVHNEFPDIPVVVLSGLMDEKVALEAVQFGAQDYLAKGPTSWESAPRAIRYAIERQQSRIALHEGEAQYRLLFENAPIGILSITVQGQITDVNAAALQILGSPSAEATKSINLLTFPPLIEAGISADFQDRLENARPVSAERPYATKWGKSIVVKYQLTPVLNPAGKIILVQAIMEDITERKWAEETLHDSEERFRTLIEQSSEGIALVGEEGNILEWNQAMERITGITQAQAASLPVWDIQLQMIPSEHRSSYSADSIKGLFSKALQTENLPQLGKRLEIEIQTTGGEHKTVTQTIFTIKTARGYRIGSIVLDITERKHVEEALQQANQDLRLSYDATIEGWSNALDLRDKETEVHTQRVINLTMQLAREMGISEADLINVRRGALLHDIGKMGVPDHILLKPDELTEEEWEIMRQHPVHAFNLLLRIDFLHPALDIPHYHHERWDGTGYPDKLQGEQIPLTARIFAVVDVWDALTSDRPYRKAWSEEKALDYICEQSGQYFDPQIVEKFLKLIGRKCNRTSGGM